MIYKMFDVVIVPFPFTDQDTEKRRPALVLSTSDFNDHTKNCVLAMITSAKNSDWPLDVHIGSIKKAGLPAQSKVRMKLFTLDSRLIIKKIGGLSAHDQQGVIESIRKLMSGCDKNKETKEAQKYIQHRGYKGSVDVSKTQGCLYGQILHIPDFVSYEAATLENLKKEFEAAVDSYLLTCEEGGIKNLSDTFFEIYFDFINLDTSPNKENVSRLKELLKVQDRENRAGKVGWVVGEVHEIPGGVSFSGDFRYISGMKAAIDRLVNGE